MERRGVMEIVQAVAEADDKNEIDWLPEYAYRRKLDPSI
jgi:hypothetical protein